MKDKIKELASKSGFLQKETKWESTPTSSLTFFYQMTISDIMKAINAVEYLPQIRTTYDQATMEYVKSCIIQRIKDEFLYDIQRKVDGE